MRGTGWKNRGQENHRREEEQMQAQRRSGEEGGETAHTGKDGFGGKKKSREELVWAGGRWVMCLTLKLWLTVD